MANNNDILELKFEGNGINPRKVRPSEIAGLIEDFEKALLTNLKREYPAIDTSKVLFTFEAIKDESIGILFAPLKSILELDIRTIVISSFISLTASILSEDYSKLSNDTIAPLKNISKFSKKYECSANFKHNGEFLSAITPKTEIKLNRAGFLKGDTTIYGELIDAGGDNPNIHLKINDDYTVIIDTDRNNAKVLAAKLYDHVGLKGYAKWEIATSKIIEFKLNEILDFEGGNVSNTFNELKKLTSGYWDNFNTNDDINKNLLRD